MIYLVKLPLFFITKPWKKHGFTCGLLYFHTLPISVLSLISCLSGIWILILETSKPLLLYNYLFHNFFFLKLFPSYSLHLSLKSFLNFHETNCDIYKRYFISFFKASLPIFVLYFIQNYQCQVVLRWQSFPQYPYNKSYFPSYLLRL